MKTTPARLANLPSSFPSGRLCKAVALATILCLASPGCNDDLEGGLPAADMDAGADPEPSADADPNNGNNENNDNNQPPTPDASPDDGGTQDVCGELSACEDECVDLQGDSRHCGDCAAACGEDSACVAGSCVEAGFPCADRWIGSVGDGVTLTDTTLGKGNDIDGMCLRSGSDEDTVMFWRVPEGGDWEIRFSSSDFDVVARVDVAAIPNFCRGNEVDCDDDGNGPNGALLSFSALEGQDMLITVDAFRNTGAGEFTMSFSRSGEAPVSNGACDNATDLMAFGLGLNFSAAVACYESTCSEADDVGDCVSECVPSLIPGALSEGCAQCFGGYAECVIDACGAECLNSSLSCDDCDYDGLCGGPFSDCAGL